MDKCQRYAPKLHDEQAVAIKGDFVNCGVADALDHEREYSGHLCVNFLLFIHDLLEKINSNDSTVHLFLLAVEGL